MKAPAITVTSIATVPDTKSKKKQSAMASNRTPQKPPTTPLAPRVFGARTAPTTASLHPNVTTRSPRSTARKLRADTIASPEPQPNSPTQAPLRPSSATGSRVSISTELLHRPTNPQQPTAWFSSQRQPTSINSLPLYKSNSTRLPARGSSQQPSHAQDSKFFFADSVHCAPRLSGSSPTTPSTNGFPVLAPPPTSYSTLSPPTSRPSSIVGFPPSRPSSIVSSPSFRTPLTPTTVPETRGHAKFVYANGTEELLPPRGGGSEMGSTLSSTQLSQLSQGLQFSFSTSPGREVAPTSPLGASTPLIGTPVHAKSPPNSRRSSAEVKARHSRALSIGSTIEVARILQEEEDDRLQEVEDSDDDLQASASPRDHTPPPLSASERIKAMEAATADARRERKVLDLEISNASLMAINKTLEREMRKQAAELRRYRRLARSGKLSLTALTSVDGFSGDESVDGKNDDDDGSDWDLGRDENEDSPEGQGTKEIKKDEGRQGRASNKKDPAEDVIGGATEGTNGEDLRATDEKTIAQDISKHQALLDASSKMNASLKRCQYVTEQLINAGKKALEHQVRPSDVHLGGRILCGDHDDDEDDEDLEDMKRLHLPVSFEDDYYLTPGEESDYCLYLPPREATTMS